MAFRTEKKTVPAFVIRNSSLQKTDNEKTARGPGLNYELIFIPSHHSDHGWPMGILMIDNQNPKIISHIEPGVCFVHPLLAACNPPTKDEEFSIARWLFLEKRIQEIIQWKFQLLTRTYHPWIKSGWIIPIYRAGISKQSRQLIHYRLYQIKQLPKPTFKNTRIILVGGFNPFEKIFVKMSSSSPSIGMKLKNNWNHHLEIYIYIYILFTIPIS